MNRYMQNFFVVLTFAFVLFACKTPNKYPTYQDALANWTSYHDVADWLKSNFNFSFSRQSHASREQLVRKPKNLYDIRSGYCIDAALFAKTSLNQINPDYKARLIWIQNKLKNDHWVTGFYEEGQLYVMDYGAGPGWVAMHGVHGPYESLKEYRMFLANLNIPNFSVGEVAWLDLSYRFNED